MAMSACSNNKSKTSHPAHEPKAPVRSDVQGGGDYGGGLMTDTQGSRDQIARLINVAYKNTPFVLNKMLQDELNREAPLDLKNVDKAPETIKVLASDMGLSINEIWAGLISLREAFRNNNIFDNYKNSTLIIRDKEPCEKKDQAPTDGSSYKKYIVCISAETTRKKVPQLLIYPALVGLVIHELAEKSGLNHDEAEAVQSFVTYQLSSSDSFFAGDDETTVDSFKREVSDALSIIKSARSNSLNDPENKEDHLLEEKKQLAPYFTKFLTRHFELSDAYSSKVQTTYLGKDLAQIGFYIQLANEYFQSLDLTYVTHDKYKLYGLVELIRSDRVDEICPTIINSGENSNNTQTVLKNSCDLELIDLRDWYNNSMENDDKIFAIIEEYLKRIQSLIEKMDAYRLLYKNRR